MAMGKVKTGLLGLGFAGAKRYIPIMQGITEFDLVGIVDLDGRKAAHIARERRIPHSSSSENLDGIEWLKGLDAVVIATPPSSHYQLIKYFLSQGKHVLTDKPFVMSIEEGEELLKLSQEKDRKLAIMHNFQFSETFAKLLRDIESGKLGKIKLISCSLLNNPRREVPSWHYDLPWGQFFDESPHSFYMVTRLVGEKIRHVNTLVYPNSDKKKKTPASVFLNYVTRDNSGLEIPVQLYFNFEAPLSEWHLTVVGDKGAGIVDYFRDTYVFLPDDQRHGMKDVFRTSAAATWQHWIGQIRPAVRYVFGNWIPGHDVVFRLFAGAVLKNSGLSFADGYYAQRILKMQFEAMNKVTSI